MQGVESGAAAGQLMVSVANGRTKTPDEWAREITDKIMSVGDTAPAPIRDQALHFKEQIYRVVRDNLEVAMRHEREWLTNQIRS